MQVEAPQFSSSSPLTSLVSSSQPSTIPSIDACPPPGARAKVTYSRKPVAPEDNDSTRIGRDSSSSSSQPASPSDGLFDSPMRSYGASRNHDNSEEHDANDVTITTEVSPATTAHAANSAVKGTSSSLFRRVESFASEHSDNEGSSNRSPAAKHTDKFQFGMAKAIYDADSDCDDGAESTSDLQSKLVDAAKANNDKAENDEAVIARIRAQAAQEASSDPFTGSLSSVPPSSSQAQSSFQQASHDSDDGDLNAEDRDESMPIARRRGGKISAMFGKAGRAKRSKFSSSLDDEYSAASEDDDDIQTRKARTFKLVSSASSLTPPADDDHAEAGPSTIHTSAPSRREKIAALAARMRKAHGEVETEESTEAEPLLDAFFGGIPDGNRRPSTSPSLDIQDSDDDEHNDAMPFLAHRSKSASSKTKKTKSKKSKPAAAERNILSDLEGDFERGNAKVASKRTAAPKEKALPKVKPLTKKEIEIMNRQTARLARENRPRLSTGHQKKTIGLNELFNKITAKEGLRNNASQGTSGSNGADSAAGEDRTLTSSDQQPSSQIPSGQSKSQHASDPIESDPIPEHSSPHTNYISSPVVPMSRQQERRLGLDQLNSSADLLPTHSNTAAAAGRVAGLATKPKESGTQQLTVAEDEDDGQLPDLASIVKTSRGQQEAQKEASRREQQLREMKLRLLAKHQLQSAGNAAENQEVPKTISGDEDDEDDLVVYNSGAILAQKHNLPNTPGKKRPTELLYRELGIKTGKTPPSRKAYTGIDANGSPNAASAGHDAGAEEQDQLMVTDDQLRTAGKGLFVASDKAAGKVPATQPQPISTQVQQGEVQVQAPGTQGPASHSRHTQRGAPAKLTREQLNATLMRSVQSQSIKARTQKEAKEGKHSASQVFTANRAAAPPIADFIKNLAAPTDGSDQVQNQDGDEDEDDPDYMMPPARDAESVIGSDVDMGSASENEAIDDAEELVDFGSADEDEENHDINAGPRDTIEDADEDDSEKENAPPPASQQSQHSVSASPSLARSVLPSRAVMDDDEDELPAPRAVPRRARRSALADDEGYEEDGEDSLQPGPFDRSRGGSALAAEAVVSQGRARVPLGDISSQSIDQSMPFSRSNTSSPAVQHAFPPSSRPDPLLFPLTGQAEDESFRTDDIPSQGGDLGRFFEPTMPPPKAAPTKSFWDQTQTQTQSQSQDPSQPPSSMLPPPTTNVPPREMVRDVSATSALGAFFADTQQDELRGESLDIFANSKNADGKARGFTQFFHTPPGWDASSMPPPKSTEVDAFAALRKAQMGEAWDLGDDTLDVLPSFDESQAEREAYAEVRGMESGNGSPEKMYMNRDGFFTQTKPTQVGGGVWSQYDTQSQSQGQSQVPITQKGSGAERRGSEVSSASQGKDGLVSQEDEEDDAPVQLKRLRRGAPSSTREEANEEVEEDDENGPPSSQPEPQTRTRNAFDVLREGPPSPQQPVKKRKSAFIEGEAEESEDEELLSKGKRGDGGGLGGVFPDDLDSPTGAAGSDEESEDDLDAPDLQELVNNERELDEAQKDELVNARFRSDMEAKDREELLIAQKAAEGGYRNRRRAGLMGIEGFLDDDADEEELRRRAAMGRGVGWKKRKLGVEDGLDKLGEYEEARAFVRSYEASHRVENESANYGFLQAPPGEDGDEDEGSDSEEEEEEEEEMGVEEDAFGPVVQPPKKIRFDEVRAKIQERRRNKVRGAVESEEEEEEGWNSDEEDLPHLAAALRDRTKTATSSTATVVRPKAKVGVGYGRSSSKPSEPDQPMNVDPTDPNDDADDDAEPSLMARLLNQPKLTRPSPNRLSSSTLDTQGEGDEPEWGNDAGLIRAPKPAAGGNSQSQGSLGKKLVQQFSPVGNKDGGKKGKGQASLLLLGKEGIMRRGSGFSSSSSSGA